MLFLRVAKTLLRCEKVKTKETDGILEHINEELVKFSDKRLESNRLLKWALFCFKGGNGQHLQHEKLAMVEIDTF